MVVDNTVSIDNILISKTIKEIKQKIDFTVFCVRHLGLIVTAVTINGFTPVIPGETPLVNHKTAITEKKIKFFVQRFFKKSN